MTEAQKKAIQAALELTEGIGYCVLDGLTRKEKLSLGKWDWEPDAEGGNSWPTLDEIMRIAYDNRQCYKFTLAVMAPKGIKRLPGGYVTFSPPTSYDMLDGSETTPQSEFAALASSQGIALKGMAETMQAVIASQSEQSAKLMGASTALIEKCGGLLDRVVNMAHEAIHTEAQTSAMRIEEMKSFLNEGFDKTLVAMELQNRLESAESQAALGPGLLKQFVEHPETVPALVDALIQSLAKGYQGYKMIAGGK